MIWLEDQQRRKFSFEVPVPQLSSEDALKKAQEIAPKVKAVMEGAFPSPETPDTKNQDATS